METIYLIVLSVIEDHEPHFIPELKDAMQNEFQLHCPEDVKFISVEESLDPFTNASLNQELRKYFPDTLNPSGSIVVEKGLFHISVDASITIVNKRLDFLDDFLKQFMTSYSDIGAFFEGSQKFRIFNKVILNNENKPTKPTNDISVMYQYADFLFHYYNTGIIAEEYSDLAAKILLTSDEIVI